MSLQSNPFPSAVFYVQQLSMASMKPLLPNPPPEFLPIPVAFSPFPVAPPHFLIMLSPPWGILPAPLYAPEQPPPGCTQSPLRFTSIFFFHPNISRGRQNTKTTSLGLPIEGTLLMWPSIHKYVCEFWIHLCEAFKK